MMDFAIGRIVLKDECRKDFFATADQLQEMASEIFAAADKQTKNGKFIEKAFVGILCCIGFEIEKNDLSKDVLAMIDEFEANQRNFCHQMKKGQNIWEAVKNSAGNAIVTAARNVKVNPQTYEEGLRKLEKMKNLSPENQPAIGTFAKHCIATLKIFQQFITDERLAQTWLAGGGKTVSDQSSALSTQSAPTRSDQLPNGKSSRRRKRGWMPDWSSKWPKCVGAVSLAGFSGYVCSIFVRLFKMNQVPILTYFTADHSPALPYPHSSFATEQMVVLYIFFVVSLISIFFGIYHCFAKRDY
ncbi:hypothetical protein niasHT_003660 [Heterodera trifolii]|uniref:Uncharacterized protein n=1 Tax=Heterodera trifolii TaxID=157864 RepID=A0ABD2M8W6_9BILA